ncbi:hypothetical protein JCM9492_02370 [Aquifex pyrophilus]
MWRILITRFFWRFIFIPLLALVFGFFVLWVLFGITYTWVFVNTLKLIKENPLLGIPLVLLEIFILILIGILMGKAFEKLKASLRRVI